jgi:hypothetical protein
MSVRVTRFLAVICLVVVTGCGREESDSPAANRAVEETASASSLSVEVRPMAETIQSGVSLNIQRALERARFSRKADHSLFTTNGRYLVWKKTHTDTLCVYDLRADEMARKIWIPRGQGPGEFEQFSGATITDEDVVYLAEPNQAKFLRFHVRKGPMEDLTFYESGFRPERVDARGTQLVTKRISSGSGTDVLGLIGSDRVFQGVDGFNFRKELGSLYLQSGRLDAAQQRAFFLTRYRPRVYVFNLDRNRFVKKVVYGDVEVEMPEPENTESGVTVYRPPQEVEFFAYHVVAVPERPDRVLINAAGGGDQHSFDRSALYELDVQTGTIVAEHDLGHKVHKVATADSSVYVYDDEKREVFAYRLRSSEP